MNKILLSTGILALSLFSCKTTEVNPDNATPTVGTYAIKVYNTDVENNSNVPAGNNIVITKVDNNTVNVDIRYADGDNYLTTGVAVSKSGSDYKLAKTYTDGTGSGLVSGNTVTWNILRKNGDYTNVTAKK